MRFANPQALFLYIAVGIAFFWWIWIEKRAIQKFRKEFSLNANQKIFKGYSKKRRRIKVIWLCVSSLFIIVALARPQMGTREESVTTSGLDVVFALDVSTSMLTEDVVPNRIKKAKHIIRNFLDKFYGDRVGVVSFAGSAYPIIPLTTDYEYIKENLDVINTSSIQNQGTNIEKALHVSLGLLDRGGLNDSESSDSAQMPAGSRIVIMLSDGEDTENVSKNLAPIKGKAVTVFTIGVGSRNGGPIPIRDDYGNLKFYKKDPKGSMVLSKLEARALETLSGGSGGKFYEASVNEVEVDEILKEISTLERAEGEGRKIVVYEEYFQYPLAVGLFFFLIFLWYHEVSRRKNKQVKRTPNIAATLGLLFLYSAVAHSSEVKEYTDNKAGIELFAQKNYSEAIRRFGSAQAENPDNALHSFNLGTALALSKSDGAINELKKSVQAPDSNLAAKGAYNLGRYFEENQKLDEAINTYQEGLNRLHDDPKADPEVRDRIKRALVQAQQQKNQQKNNKDDKDNKKDKDQQNKQQQNQDQKNNKDDKDDQKQNQQPKKDEQKQFRNPKPQFKADQLNEEDAKRILKQLSEQEKKTAERLLKGKYTKDKQDKNGKDW